MTFSGNKNSMVTLGTQSVQNESVLGTVEIPTSFYSFRTSTYTADFRNMYNHSVRLLQENADIQGNSLYYIKSKQLSTPHDNDQFVIDTINKTSIFDTDIALYKEAVKSIVDSGDHVSHFYKLHPVGQGVTDCILKSLYYTKGIDGVYMLNESLLKIVNSCSFNPDVLKIYNILLYTAPFILIDAANGCSFSNLSFFYSPYELIAANLHTYIMGFRFEDLTYLLRLQLRLELNVPQIKQCMQLYREVMGTYIYLRETGVMISTIAIPTVGLVRYLPMFLNRNAYIVDSIIVQQSTTRGDRIDDEIIRILIDIVTNS